MAYGHDFVISTVPRSRIRLCDGANCAEYKLWLILHDPVAALLRQQMTALRQTLADEDVLFAPLWRRRRCGKYNHGLVAQIVQLCHAPRRFRKVLQLAGDGVTEFFLNPKDRRHSPFIGRQIPEPWTRNGSRIGRRSPTDQPHHMTCDVLCVGIQQERNKTNNTCTAEQRGSTAYFGTNACALQIMF